MSSETPERLKQAAEDLLLSKGEAGLTLRDITEAAGANVAAVAYHFKSKDNLVSLVFGEALDEVTSLQTSRVKALPADHTLRDLIEVWLHPLLSSSGPNDREARLWLIIQRGAAEKAPGLVSNMMRAANPVEQTLLPLLARHLGHLSKDELIFRHNAVLGGLAGLVSSPIGMALASGSENPQAKELLIAWILGGLEGPAAL
jgi:AcrR family transcriptional regulator